MARETNYLAQAYEDAAEAADYFIDQIVDQIMSDGKAGDSLTHDYDGGDSYHHESHVDRGYSLLEAANLLDQLSEYEADDSGLWEGAEPRRAVEIQAAFTYGNAVYDLFKELIETINEQAEELGEEEHESRKRWPKKPGRTEERVRQMVKDQIERFKA